MGHLELCSALDQHEPLHSYLHACQFTHTGRHELVAGDPHHFFRQHDRSGSHDPERKSRGQIWYPFPVLARASFGVRGANIPAVLRAIVACGWFGIQTWIGGFALYQMLRLWMPSLENLPQVFPSSFGLQTGPAICFFLFWLLNMFVVYLGVESIRKLLVFKAIFLPVAALALLFWAISAAHGLGPILETPSKFPVLNSGISFFPHSPAWLVFGQRFL
jgi:cytosine/uracil/thiamine/allantoin permease